MTFPSADVEGRRVFLCEAPFKTFNNCAQRSGVDACYGLGDKPVGLWYAVGDEWIEWCRSEMPGTLRGSKYLYEVVLHEHWILRLTTAEMIAGFSRDFRARSKLMPDMPQRLLGIDWEAVAAKYVGIEIAPYQWGHRFNTFWYYTWDVASGCIWNEGAIKSVTLMEKRK